MGMFLNSSASFKAYQAAAEDFYYVDKTMLLAELFPMLEPVCLHHETAAFR